MDIKLDLSPETISKMVSDAVLESSIGYMLREAIDRQVKELSISYRNPLEPIIQKEVLRIVTELLRKDFEEQIRIAVHAKVQEKLTDDSINKLLDACWKKLFDER